MGGTTTHDRIRTRQAIVMRNRSGSRAGDNMITEGSDCTSGRSVRQCSDAAVRSIKEGRETLGSFIPSSRMPTRRAIATICALVAAYLVFVIHYSANGLLLDDWSFAHLVHAAVHGRLTLGALWSQHNENRMFVPNVMMVTLAVATHDNTRTAMIVSALVFVASYLCFLLVLQTYLRRRLMVVEVLATGVVWFSLADWQNALWGFQFAWYLMLFLLMAMLWLLLAVPIERRGPVVFAGAVAIAVAASYSSAQGVFLWPVGLLCLLWPLPGNPRRWPHRAQREIVVWIVAAFVTIVVYFWGLQRTQTGFSSSSWHHPLMILQSVLANVGEVFPTTNPDVGLHELIGSILLLAGAFVVVTSFRERRDSPQSALPVALILFTILFDPSVASNRLAFGVVPSLAPRYTMANLLLFLTILVYGLGHLGGPSKVVLHSGSRARLFVIGILAVVTSIQLVVSTDNGLNRAETSNESVMLGDRIVVNQDQIPHGEELCYALAGIETYTGEVGDNEALVEAQEDRLSEFSPGPYETYRAEGLPKISQCQSPQTAKRG
jgi:hypothetical protein